MEMSWQLKQQAYNNKTRIRINSLLNKWKILREVQSPLSIRSSKKFWRDIFDRFWDRENANLNVQRSISDSFSGNREIIEKSE